MDTTDLWTAAEWLGERDLASLREATYGAPGQPQVYYDDGTARDDITDLYTVLDNERQNGTPNLENAQVEQLYAHLGHGFQLSDVQIGTLLTLLDKYAPQLRALRATRDKEGQDYSHGPDPATARLVGG